LWQDLEVNVAFGKEIVLKNVKLKESALRDAGVPLRYKEMDIFSNVLADPLGSVTLGLDPSLASTF
jgi:hypothetical protein